MSERWEEVVEQLVRLRASHSNLYADATESENNVSEAISIAAAKAEPVYVSEEMTDVVESCLEGFTRTRVSRETIFTPNGFASFPRPIPGRHRSNIHADLETTPPVIGLLWLATSFGMSIITFSPCSSLGFDREGVSISHMDTIAWGSGSAHLAAAFWSVADSVHTSRERLSRGSRRRLTRKGIEESYVTVIQLRRLRYPRHADSQAIDWTCRWLVRGHWRTLPGGSQTFVAPYIKGPEGKPLRLTDRIFELIR